MVLGACCFATLGVWNDLILDHGGEPFTGVFARFVFSTVAFGALLAWRRGWRLERGLVLRVLPLGALQFGAVYCLLEGFSQAPVSLVILLFYVYPLVATLGAALLLGEPLGPRRLAVLALGLSGIALSVGAPSSVKAIGIVLGLAAGLCLGSNVVAGRHLMTSRRASPFDVVPLMFLGPAIALAAIVWPARGIDFGLDASGWAGLAGITIVGTVLPTLLFWMGVSLVGAGTASLLATVEPLVAVLLAYALLGESLTALQLVGGALIVLAVTLLSLPEAALAWRPRPGGQAAP